MNDSSSGSWWTSGPFADNGDVAERTLRADAGQILRAGIAAADPGTLVTAALARHRSTLETAERVRIIAIGKASPAMARAAMHLLEGIPVTGVLVTPHEFLHDVPVALEQFAGGHPLPTAGSVVAGNAVIRELRKAAHGDVVLCLLSGGGSALAGVPIDGVSVLELSRITNDLLRAGATITETNCVRKHLDEIKGGRLARLSQPARTFVLALSDVVGDPPDVIASGPFSPDPTSFRDAIGVLTRHDLWQHVPPGVRAHLESGERGEIADTPGTGDPCFERVSFEIIGNVLTAAQSACAHARALGYESSLIAAPVTGEARREGRILGELALALRSPAARCSIAFGETTVIVSGDGSGGRNQEIALGAALAIDGAPAVLVASMGTDGIDGPTDAAGAVATGTTLARGLSLGRNAEAALGRNDAYPFFDVLNDLIRSGATGTNVMDLQVLMTGHVDHVPAGPYARNNSYRNRMDEP